MKCSSMASLRFFNAAFSVRPWLTTSTSRHCATNHLPSRQTLAVNLCFFAVMSIAPRFGANPTPGPLPPQRRPRRLRHRRDEALGDALNLGIGERALGRLQAYRDGERLLRSEEHTSELQSH